MARSDIGFLRGSGASQRRVDESAKSKRHCCSLPDKERLAIRWMKYVPSRTCPSLTPIPAVPRQLDGAVLLRCGFLATGGFAAVALGAV